MSKSSMKKRDSSSSRDLSSKSLSPAKDYRGSSPGSGLSGSLSGELWRTCAPIWPEWSESEVNAEKWDSAKGAKDSKARKSPLTQFFEDPDGKVKIPASLHVHTWKRPSEYMDNKALVVVENDSAIDLMSANEHLLCSELVRRIISEIYIVWHVCNSPPDDDHWICEKAWRPWEHIYSLCKATKDHVPLYNSYGKYIVRLFWMGCWRKITVDDSLPFDERNNLLLPATTNQSELWPMLLTKALLKLASTEVVRDASRELEEFSAVHSLTGWIPEHLPLNPKEKCVEDTWEYLTRTIPAFDTTEIKPAVQEEGSPSLDKVELTGPPAASRLVVCASFQPLNLQEKKISTLGQMADASQALRQYGLCQLFSHTVLLTRSRDCPLVADSKPPPAPYLKLIRTSNEGAITDEPRKIPVEAPEQCVGVITPFIKSKLGPCKIVSKTSFSESEEVEGCEPACDDITLNKANSPDAADTEVPAEEQKEEAAVDGGNTDPDVVPEKTTPVQKDDMLQETWIHVQDLSKCFQKLLVFHRGSSYQCQVQRSQFRGQDERVRYFLCVDSLLPAEILLCFSALMLWGESNQKDYVPKPGQLGVEPFSWKSFQVQFPLLTINTSSCKAAVLSLPPGRHVLRITSRVQFGHHVHLFSSTEFVFGDEEPVMTHLKKESLRFYEQALSIFRALGETVKCFSNSDKLPSATQTLKEAVCPGFLSKLAIGEHWKAFSLAVHQMFCCVLGRKLTSEELFAVQSLTKELIPYSSDTKDTAGVPDSWTGRQATEGETHAATVLQASWKGYLVRKLLSAGRPGSMRNQAVSKTLLKMWTSVESDKEKHAVSLLRFMFTNNKQLEYLCGEDEWTKITFSDYSVPVHETTSSWVLLFREVFHVCKATLLVPKICSAFSCQLHVTNNDTLEEVPKFFKSVPPFTYTPNKAGYTFVAYTEDVAIVGTTWRLRLISAEEQIAQLARKEPASDFIVKEFKDYYSPNKRNVICRHAVSVSGDVCVTVQFQASKEQVFIKLSILDHETELISKTGQGQVVIPVYGFSASEGSCGGALEMAGEGQSQNGCGEGQNAASECQPVQTHHKYILQAEVLYNSWPLDDSLSDFIQTLRDKENEERQVFKHLIEEPPVVQPVTPKKQAKGAKAKEKEKPAPKAEPKPEATPEQPLDESKPHWTLRVFIEKPDVERIEVKKDTERLEQVKAMKLAWEAAEPGRAVKAFHTRQQYLKKLSALGKDQTLDLTPFIRRSGRPERLKDAAMEEEQQREQLEKIQSFRLYRETVLERRNHEQQQTRELIKEQRELFERIQEEKAELLRTFEQNQEVIRAWRRKAHSQKREQEATKREE